MKMDKDNQSDLPPTSCSGPGVCPGIAILIGYAIGSGASHLSGLPWLGWAVGLPLIVILVTGAWQYIPRKTSRLNRK